MCAPETGGGPGDRGRAPRTAASAGARSPWRRRPAVTTATQRGEGPSTDGRPPGTAPASHSGTDGTDSTAAFSGTFRHAEAVADAVLYEGYLLYPSRRSSPNNRVRWQFGVL